jgi:DNA-binding transcriptional LysR family regulator
MAHNPQPLKPKVSKSETEPTLKDYAAFCQIMDFGSLTAAAQAAGETKGTISRRLSRLEQKLGVALFKRAGRLLSPTPPGLLFHRYAKQALDVLDEGASSVQASTRGGGLLRVGVSEGFAVAWLAPLLPEFVAANPEVSVDIILTREPRYATQQIDIAVQPGPLPRQSSLICKKLIDWRRKLVAAPAYISSHGKPRRPAELGRHRLLFSQELDHLRLRSKDKKSARVSVVDLKTSILSSGTLFVREATLAGGGIAFLPSVVVDRDIRDGRLIDVMPDHEFPGQSGAMYILYPAMKFEPFRVKAFREFLYSRARALAV